MNGRTNLNKNDNTGREVSGALKPTRAAFARVPSSHEYPWRALKRGSIKTREGRFYYTVDDVVEQFQTGLPSKCLVLQLIRWDVDGHKEIRSGWYFQKRGRGRWYWARSTQLAPVRDFRTLVRKAQKRGWFK